MLSPVSAVLAADISFLTSVSRQENTPAVSTPIPAPQTEPDATNISTGANIRAVSGELQLSQNAGVLAETLGKLMNIARMDGEATDAFVNRLVTTMQSLPADQKAMLEKELGTILRGVSISILAEALKNSAGPDAAKLAIMFELARSSNAARGTRNVSSYLQDILPPSRAIIPSSTTLLAAPAPTDEIPQPHNAQVVSSAESESTQQPAKQPVLRPPEQVENALIKQSAVPSQSNLTATERPLPQPLAPAPAPVQLATSNTTAPAPPLTTNSVSTLQQNASDALFRTPLAASQETLAKTIADSQNVDFQDTDADLRSPVASPAQQDGRTNLPAIIDQFSGANPQDMEKLLLAVLLGKLPASADTVTTQALPPIMPEASTEPPIKSPLPPAAAHAKPESNGGDSALSSNHPEMLAAQKAALAVDVKTAIMDQPALFAAVAAVVTKEGIPLPFVQYPAAKDEQESDAPPRGRWPSSSDGSEQEEEAGEQPREDSGQEERVAANEENIDQSLSDGANEDGRTGNAESYYLKMSSFS